MKATQTINIERNEIMELIIAGLRAKGVISETSEISETEFDNVVCRIEFSVEPPQPKTRKRRKKADENAMSVSDEGLAGALDSRV